MNYNKAETLTTALANNTLVINFINFSEIFPFSDKHISYSELRIYNEINHIFKNPQLINWLF